VHKAARAGNRLAERPAIIFSNRVIPSFLRKVKARATIRGKKRIKHADSLHLARAGVNCARRDRTVRQNLRSEPQSPASHATGPEFPPGGGSFRPSDRSQGPFRPLSAPYLESRRCGASGASAR